MTLLADSLPASLEQLNLSNNNLGSEGADAIGSLLAETVRMGRLRWLSLRGTGIGPEGESVSSCGRE